MRCLGAAVLLLGRYVTSGSVAGDQIPVSVNKVWPANNPMETYGYYDALPLCQPTTIEAKHMSLGQILRGDRLASSLYNIKFEVDQRPEQTVCTRQMSLEDMELLKYAVKERYLFEIYVGDLPVIQPVGYYEVDPSTGKEKFLLATMFDFLLASDDSSLVAAAVSTTRRLLDITSGEAMNISYDYSVAWSKVYDISATERISRQLNAFIAPSQGLDIRWLSIINSFILSLFIISLLGVIILRVVRSDLAKFLRISDEELATVEDDSGWKLLHADVFRPPPHRMWLCACVGSGAHLFLVSLVLVCLGCIWPYIQLNGALLSIAVLGYMFTSIVSGFISAHLYKTLGGVKWAWNLLLASVMFPLPFFAIWAMLNSVALLKGSSAAIPTSTAFGMLFVWLFVTFPLTLLGGIVGKQVATKATDAKSPFPCHTNKIPRQIPETTFWRNPWLQVVAAGFLPFSTIYIELRFVFSSLWGSRIYTLYSLLLCALLILLLVCAVMALLLTYFHLNAENHQWWWRAFGIGASTSLYFVLHSLYFFFRSSRMDGFLQYVFFFGYTLIAAWGLSLILGFISFMGSLQFVKYIYTCAKAE